VCFLYLKEQTVHYKLLLPSALGIYLHVFSSLSLWMYELHTVNKNWVWSVLHCGLFHIRTPFQSTISWECTGHTMTWLWPGRLGNRVSIAWARDVSLLHIIQTDSEAHPASYSTSINVTSFHVVKDARAWTRPLTAMLSPGVHKPFTFDLSIKRVTRTTACKIQQNPKHLSNCSFSQLLNSLHNTHESTHTALTPSS
jgi:hypothetical protein